MPGEVPRGYPPFVPEDELRLSVGGFGAAPAAGVAVVRMLDRPARLKRAGAVFGGGVLAALVTLPVPLVHLFFPPAALVAGTVFGVRRLRQDAIFTSARGTCPFCGREQSLGLTGAAVRLPRQMKCHGCRRELRLDRAGPPPPQAPLAGAARTG